MFLFIVFIQEPKITRLMRYAGIYIDELPVGTTAGMVKFGTGAAVLHPLVEIRGEDEKTSLKETLPRVSDREYTCIGCGLKVATEVGLLCITRGV